jgi:hypothetical protein
MTEANAALGGCGTAVEHMAGRFRSLTDAAGIGYYM